MKLKHKCRTPADGGARRERGVALFLVLGFIFILAILASAFAINMRVEAVLTASSRNGVDAEWLCRSGVEYAKYVLSLHMENAQEPYDSLNQRWAGGPGNTNGFNPMMSVVNLTNNNWAVGTVLGQIRGTDQPWEMLPDELKATFGPKWESAVRCSIAITDMERKYNINRAAEDAVGRYPLTTAFEMMELSAGEIQDLVNYIKDWRDTDNLERAAGGETDKTGQFSAKNGPIDDLTELLSIKGITDAMYWGNSTNQLAASALTAQQPLNEDEEISYPIGLVDLFTPISKGYVNINTASMMVLQLLPGMDENRARNIIEFRAGLDGIDGTYDDEPFDNINQLRNVAGFTSAEAIANAGRFMSVRSSTFEVTVKATIGKHSRTLVAVLARGKDTRQPKDVTILYTYWK